MITVAKGRLRGGQDDANGYGYGVMSDGARVLLETFGYQLFWNVPTLAPRDDDNPMLPFACSP